MKAKTIAFLIILLSFINFFVFSGERTIPVDMILMVDKSLSMAEQGRFEDLQKWFKNHFTNQILINGDWVLVYQFYEKPEKLLEIEIKTDNDIKKVENTVANIKPNGAFTDIGLALDTIKEEIKPRLNNDRYKIMLLLTDLKQEAPWTSRYSGVQEQFESPYLIQARIIEHKNWYEITLDMDIKDRVIQTTKELYSSISNISSKNIEREHIDVDEHGKIATKIENLSEKQNKTEKNSLSKTSKIVLVSILGLILLILVVFLILKQIKPKQEYEEPKENLID